MWQDEKYKNQTKDCAEIVNSMGDYSSDNISKGELDNKLVNETFNYDAQIKAYQFVPKVEALKTVKPSQTTDFTRVLEWRLRNKVWCKFDPN